jgi:hypothetical protein
MTAGGRTGPAYSLTELFRTSAYVFVFVAGLCLNFTPVIPQNAIARSSAFVLERVEHGRQSGAHARPALQHGCSQRGNPCTRMNFRSLYQQRPPVEDALVSTERTVLRPGDNGSKEDHYEDLARMVAELSRDHAQLRAFIYEFARIRLRKDLYPRFVEGAWFEIEERMRGLEGAIDRIEADFTQNALPGQSSRQIAPPHGTRERPTRATAIPNQNSHSTTRFGEAGIQSRSLLTARAYGVALPKGSAAPDGLANTYLNKAWRSRVWRATQLIAALAVGVAIYAATDADAVLNHLGLRSLDRSLQANITKGVEKQKNGLTANIAVAPKLYEASQQSAADIPVPAEYGAYAVVKAKLTGLEQLPIRVPDPRVAISASFSTPSRTHLPVGQPQFVIFRRDLAANAPDRITVRLVAKVRRALTFDPKGNAKLTDVEQSWVIRNNSYQMKVAPLADNPEMIVVRPDPADFVLPSGRYALVLKGVGYDFTVDGPVTDMASCLERTDALDAPIYTECRKP